MTQAPCTHWSAPTFGPKKPNRPHSLPSHMGSSDPIRYNQFTIYVVLVSILPPFFPKNGTALGEPKPCCRACRSCISSQCLRRSLGNADGPSTAMGLPQILWPKKQKIDRRPKCWTLLHAWGKFMTWMSRTKGTSNYLLFFVGTKRLFSWVSGLSMKLMPQRPVFSQQAQQPQAPSPIPGIVS